MNKNFKKGFTLSEVLITVGIIGVVAAITIPTVVANYRKQTYVTQLRKISYEIEQAADLYMTDHSVNNLNRLRTSAELENFITNYFKVVKNCGTFSNCFAGAYNTIDGSAVDTPQCNIIVSVASGTSICATVGSAGEVVAFEVDINGQKGPNIHGRDYFTFELQPNGTLDDKNNGKFKQILNDGWKMNY